MQVENILEKKLVIWKKKSWYLSGLFTWRTLEKRKKSGLKINNYTWRTYERKKEVISDFRWRIYQKKRDSHW